jgi:hypothetical protein
LLDGVSEEGWLAHGTLFEPIRIEYEMAGMLTESLFEEEKTKSCHGDLGSQSEGSE